MNNIKRSSAYLFFVVLPISVAILFVAYYMAFPIQRSQGYFRGLAMLAILLWAIAAAGCWKAISHYDKR